MTNETPTALKKVKNAITNKITALITAHNEDTTAHGLDRLKNDILTSIQEDGGISGGMDEEQFEAMLDEAIFEETHVTVIFHTAGQEVVNKIEELGGFFFDYEGTNAAGNPTGTRIMPNENGDYIVENVEIGTTHIVYHSLEDTLNGLSYGTTSGDTSEFYIDKDNHEFYSLKYNAVETQ